MRRVSAKEGAEVAVTATSAPLVRVLRRAEDLGLAEDPVERGAAYVALALGHLGALVVDDNVAFELALRLTFHAVGLATVLLGCFGHAVLLGHGRGVERGSVIPVSPKLLGLVGRRTGGSGRLS